MPRLKHVGKAPYTASVSSAMRNLHPLLNPNAEYAPEAERDALVRYRGFASDMYDRLYRAIPELRGRFRFFRAVGSDDIWSIGELEGREFGVQLDPDCEVICLWSADSTEEIGTWFADPVAHAIDRIRQDYFAPEPERSS
jgi:hypothetical protein